MDETRRTGWGASMLRALTGIFFGRALARARADARLARDRLREAIDVLPEGVVFLDAEGRYVLWSRAYAEIYHRSADLFAPGRKLEETLRLGVARGDYPDAVGREEAWLAERMARLANPQGERFEQQIADGRWLMIEERRTGDGGVIGLRVDITTMKRQAAALEEALHRAEAASRAKAEFYADMSHELRTPLNGVVGLLQALAATPLDAAQSALVGDVMRAADRLDKMVNGLVDYGDADLAPTPETTHLKPHSEDDGRLRVLAADDNPTNRKVLELMLGAAGAALTLANDGREAVEAWQEGAFDVILMDLRMPVMDGLEAIRLIRAGEAGRGAARLPIVVLSANTSDADREASARAGACAHIAKPIRAEELFAAIEAVLPG